MKKLWLSFLLMCCTSLHAGQFMQADNLFPKVKFITSHGEIVVELDRSRAPLTVNNFLSYVKKNAYNNTVFHRLIPEFVLQGGGYTPEYKAIETLKPIFDTVGKGFPTKIGGIGLVAPASRSQNDKYQPSYTMGSPLENPSKKMIRTRR
ncbi:peptidylprolyl isomerase [Alishewanella longhuensis]